jgi:hypothetical protein
MSINRRQISPEEMEDKKQFIQDLEKVVHKYSDKFGTDFIYNCMVIYVSRAFTFLEEKNDT